MTIAHRITVDGRFHVLCRDKTGTFRGGSPANHSSAPVNLAGAEEIAQHMAGLGYRYTDQPPGLLLPGEMTIARIS